MIKKCINCGVEFETTQKRRKCCSRKCSNELLHPKIIIECETCGKTIKKTKSEFQRSKRHYCSNECRIVGLSKHQKGENNPNYKGANTIVKCSNCEEPIKILNCTLKNSDGSRKKDFYCSIKCKAEHQKSILLGKNNPKWRGGKVKRKCDFCGKEFEIPRHRSKGSQKNFYCSIKCKAEHQETTMLGANNINYIHGLSHDYRARYRIVEGYTTWRKEVYKRDSYVCRKCGDDAGGNLNAHHLNGYSWDVKNRTNVENGVTLCEKCHKEFHKMFGNSNNTKEQFYIFLNKLN